jgi:hypothetical protein
VYDEIIAANKRGKQMKDAQGNYDREEPEWGEDEEESLQRELEEDLAESCKPERWEKD